MVFKRQYNQIAALVLLFSVTEEVEEHLVKVQLD